jgi:hypothetical protein
LPLPYVKPYVERGKNAAIAAAAIRRRTACAVLLRRCGDLGRAEGGHDLLREPV